MRTLVLWDIDHTLLSIGGLSGEIYASVFRKMTGRALERLADMTGQTDRAITSETLRLHDVAPTETLLTTFADALAAEFAAREGELRTRGRALTGAHAALSALAGRADVVQSVLTGNMRPIADVKLAAFGLDEFVDMEVGAYGLDAEERPPLVGIARRRAAGRYGETFEDSTVLVGDTPNDVLAAHESKARVVAVATGQSDESALRSAGAEVVLPNLADTETVLRAILGVTAR